MSGIIIQDRVKYGSVSYRVLNYARFKSRLNHGSFSIQEYLHFCNNQYKPSDIQRAINSLAHNGHVGKLENGRYRYIESGVLGKLDNAYRKTLWASTLGSKKPIVSSDLDEVDVLE